MVIPSKEVKRMKLHYEWWAKAGGGPCYISVLPREEYVKNFKWFKNWVDRHFFNKVSDTLFGLVFVYSLIFFVFIFFNQIINLKYFKLQIAFNIINTSWFFFEWFRVIQQ